MQDLLNIAYRKAIHSTKSPENLTRYAEYANDGFNNVDENFSAFVGNEGGTSSPCLILDLGATYSISRVDITTAGADAEPQAIEVTLYSLEPNTRKEDIDNLNLQAFNSKRSMSLFIDNEVNRKSLEAAADARFLSIKAKEEFIVYSLEVLTKNPLSFIGESNSDAASCLSAVLEAVEMCWGADVDLLGTIHQLQKRSPVSVSNLTVSALSYRQVDISFYLDDLQTHAHLTSVEDSLGDCNVLLILDVPSNKRLWKNFFGNKAEFGRLIRGQQLEQRFLEGTKLIVPLDKAVGGYSPEFETEDSDLELQLVGEVGTRFEFSQLSESAQQFTARCINQHSLKSMSLELEPGINILAPIDQSFTDALQSDVTLPHGFSALLTGCINSKFLDLFAQDWVDLDVLSLKAAISPPLQETQRSKPDSSSVVAVYWLRSECQGDDCFIVIDLLNKEISSVKFS